MLLKNQQFYNIFPKIDDNRDREFSSLNMSHYSCGCCVAVLHQQQETNISHQNQSKDASVNDSKHVSKTCTVVENGRVVVKNKE